MERYKGQLFSVCKKRDKQDGRNPGRKKKMLSMSKSKSASGFRRGDEVATIYEGKLVFGTLEYSCQNDTGEWIVNWNNGVWGLGVPKKCRQSELIVTDRALYRGCKVRRADNSTNLIGVCRSITLSIDIRIVGTSTILPFINSADLSHLKEFKEKSVVYERGWLGVITDVERKAKIRFQSGLRKEVLLNDIVKTSPHSIESPWINEGVFCSASGLKKAKLDVNEILDGPQPQGQDLEQSHQRVCIEDIEVVSIKVAWRFQLDLMSPDKPPSAYNGARIKSLKVVKEDLSTESTFHVGNLCRYKIRNDTEFKSESVFERKLVQEYFPARLEDLNRSINPSRAYDTDPESRLAPEKVVVVELVHLTGTGDIIWQDGNMEFVRSLDLVVRQESLIDTVLMPGDFLFSKELKWKDCDVYAVVQRTDLQEKLVYMKLLTCTSPPKVLDYNLRLSEASVIPHPRYKYFNETNTIAVFNAFGNVRVGHVQGTNFSGKVSIRWQDSGKDEWCWPAEVSVFSVKGCDLECIVNLVIGEDEVSQDPKTKLHIIQNRLKDINSAWKNYQDTDSAYLTQTIVHLKTVISDILMVEAALGNKGEFFSPDNISDARTQKMTTLSGEYITSTSTVSSSSDRENPELIELMKSCTLQLIIECSQILEHLPSTSSNSSDSSSQTFMDIAASDVQHSQSKMDVDTTPSQERMDIGDSPIDTDCIVSPLANSPPKFEELLGELVQVPDSFSPNVVVEDECPTDHMYVKAVYQHEHNHFFLKVVRSELNNLRDSCPPGIKVKAFGSRIDLLSIMICGPMNTPYENSLYLFDALMPSTYPAIPPKFHFHSCGAGRLNPNLYEEGKVCVSLLGTWMSSDHKEKWTKDSNIAQVLLSIQALILVNEPYHNEPGLEADKANPAKNRVHCLGYNTILLPKVALMMINQIKNPMDPWKEEITAFYIEHIPKFILRWKYWLLEAEKNTNKTLGDLNSTLNLEDKPGFAIMPIAPQLRTSMISHILTLENLHKTICKGIKRKEPVPHEPSPPGSATLEVGDGAGNQ